MKKNLQPIMFMFLLISMTLTGCELIGDIFKAGVWVGILLVVVIIALVLWLIAKAKR